MKLCSLVLGTVDMNVCFESISIYNGSVRPTKNMNYKEE